jgi:hypothetical protein
VTDKKDEPNPQMIPATFPPPQRKTPVPQSTFRHQHEWGQSPDGKRMCKTCKMVMG